MLHGFHPRRRFERNVTELKFNALSKIALQSILGGNLLREMITVHFDSPAGARC
jgi:hypothetical protein